MKNFFTHFASISILLLAAFNIPLFSAEQSQSDSLSITKPSPDAMYRIKLQDGSEFFGRIISRNSQETKIALKNGGELTIKNENINSMELIKTEDFREGGYWFKNPNPSRYLISSSGFNLEPGEGYFQNVWVIFNSVQVGVTDWFSLGVGIELISLFAGTPIYYVYPKIAFEVTDNFRAGVGFTYFNIAGLSDDFNSSGMGLGYGMATYGTRDDNITLGLGFSFGEEFNSTPSFTLSGMTRVSKHLGLVSENWFISDDNGKYYYLLSYGIRFIWEGITVDLAFINNSDIAEGLVIGIPFLDFVVNF